MSMLVNLEELLKNPVSLEGEMPLEALDYDLHEGPVTRIEPVQYRFETVRDGSQLLLNGRLSTGIECECVRCLKPFTKAIEIARWKSEVPLEGEERATVVNDFVDLTPYVRDDILLSFPRYPVCGKPDCVLPGGESLGGAPSGGSDERERSVWAELDNLDLESR